MLPFSRPSCYFKTRPPSCALGTSFYTVSEGSDLMTYVSDNYTSYSAPSCLNMYMYSWQLYIQLMLACAWLVTVYTVKTVNYAVFSKK